jgi:hypothetical protein
MKFKTSILILAGLFLGLSFAFSQEDEFVLHHKEIGKHQRPLVRFDHERHLEIIDCNRCHHDYDENGNNTAEDGQSCSVCHSRFESQENPIPLIKAFHIKCKGCHEERISRGKTSGPILCGTCHKMP